MHGGAPLRRSFKRPFAALAVAVLVPALLGGTAAVAAPAQPAPASVPAVVQAEEVGIVVAPAHGAMLRPGEDLQLSVTLSNGTKQPLGATRIAIGLSDDTLADSPELAAWLRPSAEDLADADGSGVPDDGHLVATVDGPSVPVGASSSLAVTVPAAALGLDGADWGAQGIVATLLADDAVVAQSRSTVVFLVGEAPRSPLSVATPIAAPVDELGLIPSELLAAYTGPGGVLSRSLDAALSHQTAIALDPKILVSIRVLGASAPRSAVDWLTRLAEAPNEIFPLPYADADLAAQAQLGVEPFLAPVSFGYAIDAKNFSPETPAPTETPTPTEEATDSATPGGPGATENPAPETSTEPDAESGTAPPTDAVMGSGLPSLEQLLAWPYSFDGVAWPAAGTMNAAMLPALSANSFDTVIVAGSNVANTDLTSADSVQPPASSRTGDTSLLVADTELDTALREALNADRESDWQAAMARAAGAIAVAAGEPTARPLLAALPRDWPSKPGYVNATLLALEQLPIASLAPLSTLRAAPAADVTLSEGAEPAERLATISSLLERETSLTGFSTAVEDATTITGPERASVMTLLGVGWLTEDSAWREAVGADLLRTNQILDSVSVVQSPSVLVVGGSAQFPVTVQNTFTEPVSLRVNLLPSNGRLVVDESADVTINAGSSSTVLVPVSAHVGNGPVNVTVTLTTAAGVQLGSSVTIPVNVQADWEGLGAALLGGAILLFFGFGVFRNIRRRRRERAAGEQETGEPGTGEQGGGDTVKPSDEVTATDAGDNESPRG